MNLGWLIDRWIDWLIDYRFTFQPLVFNFIHLVMTESVYSEPEREAVQKEALNQLEVNFMTLCLISLWSVHLSCNPSNILFSLSLPSPPPHPLKEPSNPPSVALLSLDLTIHDPLIYWLLNMSMFKSAIIRTLILFVWALHVVVLSVVCHCRSLCLMKICWAIKV